MGLRANLMHIFGVFNKKEEGSAVTIDRRYEMSEQDLSSAKVEQNSEELVTSKSCKVFSHKDGAFRKS